MIRWRAVVGCLIVVASVAPARSAAAGQPLEVQRIGGANRFATAAGVAQASIDDDCAVRAERGQLEEGQSEGDCRRESRIPLALIREDSFADGLSAASASASRPGSLLLTPPERLPPEVIDLGPRFALTAAIFGSPAAVSTQVEQEVIDRGYAQEVFRWAGADRYGTSVEIARWNRDTYSDGWSFVPSIILVSGENWPDGLSAAALAELGSPILLTRRDTIPQVVADFIRESTTQSTIVYIVGGDAAVSPAVEAELREISDAGVVRIRGADRSATARAVADAFLAQPEDPSDGPQPNGIILIRPDSFADAITAPALIHSRGAPIIIPATPTELGDANIGWLRDHANELESVTTLGDSGVVDERVVQQAIDAICSTRDCSR